MEDSTTPAPIDWASVIGGLLKTVAQGFEFTESNALARRQTAQQEEQYKRLAALQDPQALFAKIMALKKNLSEKEQQMISRAVAANLVAGGAGGATGIIEEAIADALLKADSELFTQATNALMQSQGLASGVLRQTPLQKSSKAANPFGSVADLIKEIYPSKKETQPPELPQAEDTFSRFSSSLPDVG